MVLDINITKKLTNKKNDFNLNIEFKIGNELIVLFGPSGAGKTLTFQCIAGLTTPEQGHIIINNNTYFNPEQNINLTPQKRKTGYVFQNYALFPHMTIKENINFGIQKTTKTQDITKILETFDLTELEDRYPEELSGGQQQRVALARALITKPDILLLDEPFSALDYMMRIKLRQDLKELQNKTNIPILLITHNPVEAYIMADKIIIYHNGRIEQIGTPQQIFNQPKTTKVAKIIGIKNIHTAQITHINKHNIHIQTNNTTLTIPKTDNLKLTKNQQIQWCIRPERIKILEEPCKDNEEKNIFKGTIANILAKNSTYLLFFKGPFNLEIEIAPHVLEKLELEPEQKISVMLKKSFIHPLHDEKE